MGGSSADDTRERARTATTLLRRALVDRMAAPTVVLVEAPGGYGKSTVVAQAVERTDRVPVVVELDGPTDTARLIADLARAARRRGLLDLADALTASEPSRALQVMLGQLAGGADAPVLVVDDAHHLEAGASAWLAAVVDDTSGPVFVMGRRLAAELRAAGDRRGGVVVGPDDLIYSEEELASALALRAGRVPSPSEVRLVGTVTGRWPAAVGLAGAQLAAGRLPTVGPAGETPIRRMVDELLAAAAPDVRALCAQSARLPLLSPAVVDLLGGSGSFDRVVDSGLPLTIRPDGWLELAEPVREVLAATIPAPLPALRAVAAEYARHGELADAVSLLVGDGDVEGAWAVLAGQRRAAVAAIGVPLLAVLAELTADEVLGHCLAGVVRAAQAIEEVDADSRAAWLRRAGRVARMPGAPRRALDAELARERLRTGDLEGSVALARDVLAVAPAVEHVTRARAHQVVGIATIVAQTATAGSVAARELAIAAQLYRLAGERQWEAMALMNEGFGVHLPAGAFTLAEQRIGEALALLGAADRQRALVLTYHAEALMHLGRYDEATAALGEANAIGRRLLDERITGYAAWTSMEVAGQRRDLAAVLAWMDEADRHPGDWFPGQAGVEYLCQCVEALLRVGEPEAAAGRLARAEARAHSSRDDMVRRARARYEALAGDPATGLAHLEGLDASATLYPRDRWVLHLIRAACLHRLGRAREADAAVAQALVHCTALGDPGRAERVERELLVAAGHGSASTAAPAALTVQLLGGFAVRTGRGEDVSPPVGHPALLVELVALRRTLSVEEAIDMLWPEADLGTGRSRLRNLLNRIRSASGDLVERRGEVLVLSAGVDVDVVRFEDDAQVALSAPPDRRAGLARRALQRYTGELLPGDLCADWAAAPRERLRRWYLALVDLVSDDALARGDLDEALQLIDRALDLEPLDESRYMKAARALLAQGRRRSARELLVRALAVAEELGVAPGPELRALAAALA